VVDLRVERLRSSRDVSREVRASLGSRALKRDRKSRFVDCNPRWGMRYGEQPDRYITFDCPEGHADCFHTIPVTPGRDGVAWTRDGAIWDRVGDDFATMTITPSIARRPRYESREKAIEAGCLLEYIDEALLCAMHIEITRGEITFSGDSR
jgi:hypothetical protein